MNNEMIGLCSRFFGNERTKSLVKILENSSLVAYWLALMLSYAVQARPTSSV
jgi:hypothetical protein